MAARCHLKMKLLRKTVATVHTQILPKKGRGKKLKIQVF